MESDTNSQNLPKAGKPAAADKPAVAIDVTDGPATATPVTAFDPSSVASDGTLTALQDTAPAADSVAPAFTPSVAESSASATPTAPNPAAGSFVMPGVVVGGPSGPVSYDPSAATPSGLVSPSGAAGGGDGPANPINPANTVPSGDNNGGMSSAPTALTPKPSSRLKIPKAALAALIVVLVLGGGAAAYYFGYKVNPSVIYSQSLSNTGKGYDKLIDYVDQQTAGQKNQSYTGDGSYKLNIDGFASDGKLGYKSNGSASELTFDAGIGVGRVGADVRALKSSGATPDIYVKADGVSVLGDLVGGTPQMTSALDKLDGQWVAIDHTLIDNLGSEAGLSAASTASQPTRADLLGEARAFGKVNQDYVFSTAKDKAVTTVVKKHGIETVGGHKAYHYTVTLQKDHVKAYITAQRDALKASQLGAWLKKNNYDTAVYAGFDDASKSANDIKASDTFDVWMDVDKRVVYKLRFNDKGNTTATCSNCDNGSKVKNPAENFVDIGLDYRGGDSYPFFVSGQDKSAGDTTTYSFVTTLNTKTHATDFKLDVKASGSSGGSLTANFTYKPSATPVKIDKPAGAKPLGDVLNDFGLGGLLSDGSLPQASVAPAQPKTAASSDLKAWLKL